MTPSFGLRNIWIGLATLALFMGYGFWMIYLRDFAPGKAEWIATYSSGKHFEARLAHVELCPKVGDGVIRRPYFRA